MVHGSFIGVPGIDSACQNVRAVLVFEISRRSIKPFWLNKGRGLLREGLCWRVGNGTSILVYKDRWLPRPNSFQVISPPVLGSSCLVSSLWSALGSWNSNLIRRSFFAVDADLILSLPTSSLGLDYLIIWHYENNGLYSVKSGYRLG
ncbi:hypothetical protein JRO89_XS01G0136400 [Xanthoceras sorbifolium]|uniref:Uncharacterized protein n=1 Tax=Xanthoceras sorbifolium TaxID=99658 RepID=A0ABQ8IJ85_9ROSI|nr:hypothetical protein JRO89_XS01G0136400 [Xanthoceras sorbifolium]